jgi:hypothetical protein
MQAAEFRALGAPRSSLRRQRWSYFQTALRQFIANQIPGPARSAASRRRLGFCQAKVSSVRKAKGPHRCNPLFIWRARQDESGHWIESISVNTSRSPLNDISQNH